MRDPALHAPELPEDAVWCNAAQPLRLRHELSGHVVLLDFWTSCCVNCLHVLDTLGWLEERFAGRPFTVVGVHSGKFPREQQPEHVRAAVAQLGVRHPVLVDEELRLWRAYACRAWPTLVLIDARGRIRFQGSGEPDRERMARAIEALLAEREGCEPGSPPAWSQAPPAAGGRLAFPAKVAVDAPRGLLWIADTGHHRVVAADLATGAVRHVAGCGAAGAAEGPFAAAAFRSPRGITVHGVDVYVADSGNHRICALDPAADTVRTVLGTGVQVVDLEGGRAGRAQGLNSPFDVLVHDGLLYLAMAGSHQLWRMDLASGHAGAFAGTGAEALVDGPFAYAVLAQPAGLAAEGFEIVFADSESSAVRVADLDQGDVRTVVGRGLFEFGDADGDLATARLQHPMAVACHAGTILVADTYNDAVKRLDRRTRMASTILGPDAGLCRPEGMAVHADQLFVADTGNHRILRVDLVRGTCAVFAP
ncbi:MAG: redoxin family protein [Planctomycetes bacterium]|nr:redoxin family protein [Planctomycetota bacterium]